MKAETIVVVLLIGGRLQIILGVLCDRRVVVVDEEGDVEMLLIIAGWLQVILGVLGGGRVVVVEEVGGVEMLKVLREATSDE